MKFIKLVSCFVLAIGIQALDVTQSPGCVSNCWDNSQYVSTCSQQTNCLCDDANFQSVVLQCLYSQCQTTHFGAALHQTLAICSNFESDPLGTLPQLIRHKGLRKRQGAGNTNSVLMGHSASVVQSTRHSATGRLSVDSSTTGRLSPTSIMQASSFLTSVYASAINNTFHLQSTNGAARLRTGR